MVSVEGVCDGISVPLGIDDAMRDQAVEHLANLGVGSSSELLHT
jgi:hypothetical protein